MTVCTESCFRAAPKGSGVLEWIASLPFRYDQLDAGKAIKLLARSSTLLVAAGERRPCQFSS
jgi:hypothetical protein